MSGYSVITSDHLEHHGVKGMRWGVVHEDENTARRVGRRLSSSIRRNRQHEGYYNPNVGSASSRTSQEKDKTGTSASSGNDRRVSSKVHKNISIPSNGAVVAAPGVKDKQIESKFNWPGDTLVDVSSGISYRLKEKGGKTYEIEFPYDEMKKYDGVEDAKNAIPNIVYQYCKDNDLYLTEKMFKAIVYSMSSALSSTYGNIGEYMNISGQSLGHSDHLDIIDVSDTLQHAQHQGYYSPNLDKNSTSIEQYPYQIGKCYLTRDGGRANSDKTLMHVVLTSKNGKSGKTPDFVIALNKFNSAGEAVDSFLNTVKNAYPSYWRQAPNSVRAELIRQAVSLYYRNIVKPQHEGYYSPNLLSHSYTIISSDDELYHHGILGMKWGVRRYQNPDGSLTAAGRRHYGRNYTIRELKKNIQSASTYEEKKAAVTANKVNRITKTNYRNASTLAATSLGGLTGAGTMAGLMYAGLMSVNPLLPIASLVGGVASGKAINAGRGFINHFRNIRVEMIDRALDKEHYENKSNKDERLNRAIGMMNDLDNHDIDGYKKKRSSFSGDLEKDYTERIIDDVRVARETGNYAMEFLERGLDQNQKTGEDLKGKELDEAYLKYLLEEEEKLMHK